MFPTPPAPTAELTPLFILEAPFKDVTVCAKILAIDKPAEIFVEAGCAFNTPSCGPCMGGHMGVMAKGEKCVSTTNRNFVGRMGDTEALIYLASPQVAAASAIAGYIANPEKVGKE